MESESLKNEKHTIHMKTMGKGASNPVASNNSNEVKRKKKEECNLLKWINY